MKLGQRTRPATHKTGTRKECLNQDDTQLSAQVIRGDGYSEFPCLHTKSAGTSWLFKKETILLGEQGVRYPRTFKLLCSCLRGLFKLMS